MARDYTVSNFKSGVPPIEHLNLFLEDLFQGMGKISQTGSWFTVSLPGKPSNPFQRLVEKPRPENQDERWIEVWVSSDSVEIMTRLQDTITNIIASGLASTIARFWEGEFNE